MKRTPFYILFFITSNCFAQTDSIEILSINKMFHLEKKSTLKSKTPITAYDLGINYACFADDGKISIYDLNNNCSKIQEFQAFTKDEVVSANFGQKMVASKEINIVKIDNKRNKVGYTLKYAIFKDIEINTLKTDILTFQGSTNHELIYLKQDDGYARFTKFHLDSQTMDGDLGIFIRKDIKKKNIHFYDDLLKTAFPKISSLKLNKKENIYGGITYDNKLLLWNKNEPREVNMFANDTLKLVSFDFKGNDTVTTLYSDGNMYFTIVNNFNYQKKIDRKNVDMQIFDSFIYNETKDIFIGSKNHSELVLFRITDGVVVLLSETKLNRTFRDYKISDDGNWLSIL